MCTVSFIPADPKLPLFVHEANSQNAESKLSSKTKPGLVVPHEKNN